MTNKIKHPTVQGLKKWSSRMPQGGAPENHLRGGAPVLVAGSCTLLTWGTTWGVASEAFSGVFAQFWPNYVLNLNGICVKPEA